jgi:O-antigen ligase
MKFILNIPESGALARLFGPFSDPVPGTFLVKTCFPLLGGLLGWVSHARSVSKSRKNHSNITLFLFIVMVLASVIFITGERIAFLSYVLGCLFFFIAFRQVRLPFLLLGIFAVVAIACILSLNQGLYDRMILLTLEQLGIGEANNFVNTHYGQIYLRAWRVWTDYPVFGIGMASFRHTCDMPAYEQIGSCNIHPHNTYLQFLLDLGVIGLSLFGGLLYHWGRSVGKAVSDKFSLSEVDWLVATTVGSMVGLNAFLWPIMSTMGFFSNWNGSLFWWAIALTLGCATKLADQT